MNSPNAPRKTPVTVDEIGVTGNALLSAVLTGKRERFLWNGPGSTVRMFWAQTLISIDMLTGLPAADLDEAKQQVRDVVADFAKADA